MVEQQAAVEAGLAEQAGGEARPGSAGRGSHGLLSSHYSIRALPFFACFKGRTSQPPPEASCAGAEAGCLVLHPLARPPDGWASPADTMARVREVVRERRRASRALVGSPGQEGRGPAKDADIFTKETPKIQAVLRRPKDTTESSPPMARNRANVPRS
jgi:hypothetical protein